GPVAAKTLPQPCAAVASRNYTWSPFQCGGGLIADSAPLSAVEGAAVTKRRSASSGLLPRDQVRAWVSAAKASAVYRSVCSAGRGEWCHHVIAGMPGACWRALFEPGVRLTRRRDCGPRAP